MTINYSTNINDINKSKVLLLIEASLQAYNAFDKSQSTTCQKVKISPPSSDYEFVECWSGVDSLFHQDGTEEVYGVVFRSYQAPHSYIFAFRGTASILDMLDDLGVEHSHFAPYDKSITVDKQIKVEAGFFNVYTESLGNTQSMQTQLFHLLDKYTTSEKPIDELMITGHSLGSSLCELFTLDIALSRPNIKASTINYACPRTGNKEYVEFYDAQLAQQDPGTKTLRVQNTYDKVPCVPLQDMGYKHTSYAFLVAFYKGLWLGEANLLSCHSALNYQAVLKCAAENGEGVCIIDGLPVPGNGKDYKVKSIKPDTTDVCSFW